MSRDDFVRKWRNHLAGLALFGVVSEQRDGPLVRAAKVMDIPAEVDRILGMMHRDLAGEEQPAKPALGNGLAAKRNGVQANR